VSQFIDRVGGDASRVSVWGESAGASSILHHLVRDGGKTDPLFRSFVAQSPAFQWSWDNSNGGKMDSTYQSFSNAAGCKSTFDMACLKTASVANITAANQAIFEQTWAKKQFPVGPSVDGQWIQTLPALSFTGPGRFFFFFVQQFRINAGSHIDDIRISQKNRIGQTLPAPSSPIPETKPSHSRRGF